MTAIGWLQVIGGVLIIVLGVLFLLVSPLIGAPFIVLGLLVAFIGRALLRGRNWAWTLDLVLNVLGIVLGLALLIFGSALALVSFRLRPNDRLLSDEARHQGLFRQATKGDEHKCDTMTLIYD